MPPNFKKFLATAVMALLVATTILFNTSLANSAGDFGLTEVSTGAGYTTAQSDAGAIANLVIKGGLSMLAVIFLGVMLYAGLRWMTARGNEELVTKAKNALQAAFLGLVVVVLAYALASFVLGKLGVK